MRVPAQPVGGKTGTFQDIAGSCRNATSAFAGENDAMANPSQDGKPISAEPLPAVAASPNPPGTGVPFSRSELPNGEGVGGGLQNGPATIPVTPHPLGGAELPLSDAVLGEDDADPDTAPVRDPDLEASDDDTAQNPENGLIPRI
jgi:hypothetical protein